MAVTIQHKGVVERIEGDKVFVKVERGTACQACHAKGLCGEQGGERRMRVVTPNAREFSAGDRVIVSLESTKMGFSAIIWAYLFPLCILLVALFSAHALGVDDGVAALSAIVATALYYVLLYFIRRYIDRKIKFTIIKE
jgi:sigma-E factor negative regulatory protein RseC